MPKFKVFIAWTIDWYIAKTDWNMDWLNNFPNPNKDDYWYNDFIAGIDIIVMGRNTYDVILWFWVERPYPDAKTYIVTSKKDFKASTPNTHLLHQITQSEIELLSSESKKNIWVLWWGTLISHFINLGAVDDMLISIIPMIIWEWVPLFPNNPKETNFALKSAESFESGIVNLHYIKK